MNDCFKKHDVLLNFPCVHRGGMGDAQPPRHQEWPLERTRSPSCGRAASMERVASSPFTPCRSLPEVLQQRWCSPLTLPRGPTAALLLLLLLVSPGSAICPSRCTCDDETLETSCVDAGLEVVPIQLNPDLKVINLRYNRITKLHMTLPFYTNLRVLDMSRNRIASLGSLNFEYQQKLTHLNVSGNEIANLNKDAFRGLRTLRVLDLSENLLQSLEGSALSELTGLWELYISKNKIINIGDRAFEKLGNLRVLDLDDNQLLEIPTSPLKNVPSLKELSLSENLVEGIDEDTLYDLRELRKLALQSNIISRIHRAAFDGLNALQYLDVSENNLTFVPTAQLSKLSHLEELDLSGNSFTVLEPVAFQSLFHLRKLKVSRLDRLRRVDVRAFVDNTKLESVFMDDNAELSTLPPLLFHGNPALVEISVRGNAFTTLDASHFPLDQLHYLYLSANPLHCNCSLLWLWMLAQKQVGLEERNITLHPSSLPEVTPKLDIDGIRCAEPETMRNLLIGDVPENEVRCDTSWFAVIIVTIVVVALFALTCGLLLILGNWKWCRKPDESSDVISGLHHNHMQNGGVLMLMTTKDNLDPIDNFVLKHKDPIMNEMQYQRTIGSWDAIAHEKENGIIDPRQRMMYHNQYQIPNKKPTHIVYV